MFLKRFEALLDGLYANTQAAERQVEEAGELNTRLYGLEKMLNDRLSDLVKIHLAVMTGTERKRYDDGNAPIEVVLPPQDVDNQ